MESRLSEFHLITTFSFWPICSPPVRDCREIVGEWIENTAKDVSPTAGFEASYARTSASPEARAGITQSALRSAAFAVVIDCHVAPLSTEYSSVTLLTFADVQRICSCAP